MHSDRQDKTKVWDRENLTVAVGTGSCVGGWLVGWLVVVCWSAGWLLLAGRRLLLFSSFTQDECVTFLGFVVFILCFFMLVVGNMTTQMNEIGYTLTDISLK